MKKNIITLFLILTCIVSSRISFAQDDPLPSWNDDTLKASIIAFVKSVTMDGTSTFVPVEDRVATFDNDGTLWCEKPLIQGLFAMYRAKQMVEKNPSLKQKQPYKAIASNDMAYIQKMSEQDLIKLVVATHTGLTEDEYEKQVADFFANAKAPNGKSVADLVYKPQVELLQYLRANGFKTYICSGGTVDFMRAISIKYYGIPPEQVIGSTFVYVYKDSAGINDIYRLPKLATFNDKQVKPVSIQYHIGKRPIFACGNEGGAGDVYMLRFSQGGKYPSYQLIVNHDDKEREAYYQEKDNKSLNWAKKYGWHVVSMKGNWKTIFATN
ncbi:HAD family hydrolase [Pinibacter aurantiacus]|uniref:Haloacid dehalogenase-like hydrolase n=1 Tax=Pinibacter aurantiacus TaxID=2851599 RepID=A0A9E2W9V3_9BACT|nr:HAD family hydrolase [Pinibacter aurantiacus]MBV4360302.1 haloacid dehalogenase-like hydrolase [Pinibacter aurantiacus]